ncbi:MAG: hypothetical protein KJ052_08635 [Candidatus Hydrogenedentes bacterium]|nr:hypothetical protein [Candidatus Hydrogenedentota bacterium]
MKFFSVLSCYSTFFAACAVFSYCATLSMAEAESIDTVRETFANPTRDYRSAPLWVWNDMLTEEQIRSTLRDLASQNVKQAFVHPRPGLMTPYLSDEWFALWQAALDEAEALDMNIWIYDENSYPSGFAGGFVPDQMPESRGQGVTLEEATVPPAAADEDVLAVYAVNDGARTLLDAAALTEKQGVEGQYLVAKRLWAGQSPWFGGKSYVDLLRPGVTEKFLDITLGAYKDQIGAQFAKRMPGSFTDEPHLAPAGGLHWTPDLPEVFEQRWGYSLMDKLPSLFQDAGDWKRVRHNYYALLNELFIERWAKPYHDWCEREGLEFTGHYWEHEWPNATSVPDNMAMYAWHQRPAIDILFNQYGEGVHAQFGNARAVIELGSVANQLGRQRTLCETYGGGGWDLRLEDMKRIGDWVTVLGVNTINEHLSHITIRGARKGDYPQTFSYHEPWWDAYHVVADYLSRVSVAMSHGRQVNDVLILEPTTTAWMYQVTGREHTEAMGAQFQELVTNLAQSNVEFDLGSEDILARWGSVENGKLRVGEASYGVLVLPSQTENLDAATMTLIESFLAAGGEVRYDKTNPPTLVDGQPSTRFAEAAKLSGAIDSDEADPLWLRQAKAEDGISILQPDASEGIVYHQRRRFDDGELLFLVNTSMDKEAFGDIVSTMASFERWNPQTGETTETYPSQEVNQRFTAAFKVPPCGSLLLFLSHNTPEHAQPAATSIATFSPTGEVLVTRVEPNVLTLDYVDVSVGGETRENTYYYAAAELIWQKHGLPQNPWDHAVQFADELISKTFAEDSGFEATYRFTIEGDVPQPLYIVIERPDLYTVTCNGATVEATPGEWWLDKAFGRIDISACAQTGENAVTITAQPFTMFHELAAAYVLGDFALRNTDSGFVIAPRQDLTTGPWNGQGLPLYGNKVAYQQRFKIEGIAGKYFVALPEWYGSVAQVRVNGVDAGYIYHQPWECDVTGHIVQGENIVEVVVTGTLKNTLGPHHGNPPLGIAAPPMFRQGPNPGPPPAAEYSTVGYGLFAPFELRNES